MAVLLMRESVPTEVVRLGASSRNRLSRRKTKTRDGVRKPEHASASPRVLRTMVVDDNRHTADALTNLVRRSGHVARVAYDGFAALRLAATLRPNVVLLDLEMPFMNGLEVARHLRRDSVRKDCLIIAITEQVDDVRSQQLNEAGIDLLLLKPVDLEIVEMLLLRESERLNRSQTDNVVAQKASSQFNCQLMRGMAPLRQWSLV